MVVCQYLDFNMAGRLYILLNEHTPIPESSLSFIAGSQKRVFQVLLCKHGTSAASPTAMEQAALFCDLTSSHMGHIVCATFKEAVDMSFKLSAVMCSLISR